MTEELSCDFARNGPTHKEAMPLWRMDFLQQETSENEASLPLLVKNGAH